MHPCHYLTSILSIFLSISIAPLIVHGVTDLNQSKTLEYYTNKINSSNTCSKIHSNCSLQDGIIIPIWRPQEGISTGDRISRAIVYLLALIYMFIGVAIISDRFMASIEVITSQKREIRKKNPDGTVSITTVAIWNETVSNLTLMALGSSAPEILLSIIEVVGKNFKSGDLGPGTIVGSAAFNLFVIIAICIMSIPSGEVRRIRHQRVFFVTTAWSIFAYIWLWAIVAKISPGYIEVWEGTLTFLFFPLTVFSAYIVDTKVGQFIRIRITSQKQVLQLDNHTTSPLPISGEDLEGKGMIDGTNRNSLTPSTNDMYRKKTSSVITGSILEQLGGSTGGLDETGTLSDQIESQQRQEFIEIWRELRKQYPNHDMTALNEMASLEMMERAPKSRAYYRIQATKRLGGGGGNVKKRLLEKLHEPDKIDPSEKQTLAVDTTPHISKIHFEPSHYTVLENAGYATLHVVRTDGNLRNTVYVDYMTEDGTATHGGDYEPAEGTLIFYPMETHKQIQVKIIDDEIFEEDEHFSVKLSNLKIKDNQGRLTPGAFDKTVQLAEPSIATVMIIDDDHSGLFVFDTEEKTVVESDRHAEIKVLRTSGARGRVRVPYTTEDETALNERDYIAKTDEVIFENEENEKTITIEILDRDQYQRNESFLIRLGEPSLIKESDAIDESLLTEHDKLVAELGRPKLGERNIIRVRIHESKEFKNAVDKALYKANTAILVGTSTWLEQFKQAFSVKDDDDDVVESGESNDDEDKPATCKDYMLHFVSFFWKFLFAFVPPTSIGGGWVCFVVSIIIIGLLTAVIGDLATHFGCTVGLTDTMTAIAFVALGTSLPDTFASKVAAEHDKYADSSVGNVNGSNAVNVFLGIGLPWAISAWYHYFKQTKFEVQTGSLSFSVTLFCTFAAVAVTILLLRRLKCFGGGELGGPMKWRIISSLLFLSLWITYLVLSGLENYCHINL
ncbi:unnamed protein product [Adineta steineri]|uniref:Calx-beta domain-containing protein n=1 Tax=Adineta steineri TaxID=433720 RepID=A0A813XQT7_9BILA|nr:unnamed protein product [Adineta steineri]CAF1534890.1 unnamed protein product [Adineta steineri]